MLVVLNTVIPNKSQCNFILFMHKYKSFNKRVSSFRVHRCIHPSSGSNNHPTAN